MNGRTCSSRKASSSVVELDPAEVHPSLLRVQVPGAYRSSPSRRRSSLRVSGDEGPALRPAEVQLHVGLEGEAEPALHVDAGARGAVRHVARVAGTPSTPATPPRPVRVRRTRPRASSGDGCPRSRPRRRPASVRWPGTCRWARRTRGAGSRSRPRGRARLARSPVWAAAIRSFHSRTARAKSDSARAPSASTSREPPVPDNVRHAIGAAARFATGAGNVSTSNATSASGFHPDHDVGHRARADELPIPRADRYGTQGSRAWHPWVTASSIAVGAPLAANSRAVTIASIEGDGREADPELLGDEYQVDQIGSVTTARFREAHGDRPGADQGRPEPRVEAEGLGGTYPCGRALLLEQRRERVPELLLLERQREVLAAERMHGHLQNDTLKSQRYVRTATYGP